VVLGLVANGGPIQVDLVSGIAKRTWKIGSYYDSNGTIKSISGTGLKIRAEVYDSKGNKASDDSDNTFTIGTSTTTPTPIFTPTPTPTPTPIIKTPTPTPTPTPVIKTPTPTPTPVSPDAAQFISQNGPPAIMLTGQTYAVSVTYKNTGSNTWPAISDYKLGRGTLEWGINRVDLPTSVSPGQQVTFNFTITAPNIPGVYGFQWGMLLENVYWFHGLGTGDLTPNINVSVIPPPEPTPTPEELPMI
jgi:hypothetical protein